MSTSKTDEDDVSPMLDYLNEQRSLSILYRSSEAIRPHFQDSDRNNEHKSLGALNFVDLIEEISDEEVDSLAIFQSTFNKVGMTEIFSHFPLWETLLKDENHPLWESRCKMLMSAWVLESSSMSSMSTYKKKLMAFQGGWNSSIRHCSSNLYLKEDIITAHRIPRADQTDAIRGKLGFHRGVHVWDIRFHGNLGTHCSVGIGTRHSRTQCQGYRALVGSDAHSFGWELVTGDTCHKGGMIGKFPASERNFSYKPGETLRMVLDCESNTSWHFRRMARS